MPLDQVKDFQNVFHGFARMIDAQVEARQHLLGIVPDPAFSAREDTLKNLRVLPVEHRDDLGEDFRERGGAVQALPEPLLDVAVRDDAYQFAVRRGDDLTPVSLDRRDEVLVHDVVIAHVQVAEDGDLGPIGSGYSDILEEADRLTPGAIPRTIRQER